MAVAISWLPDELGTAMLLKPRANPVCPHVGRGCLQDQGQAAKLLGKELSIVLLQASGIECWPQIRTNHVAKDLNKLL